jgi:Tat protein secretion system quality control protein TatD with DNase activity
MDVAIRYQRPVCIHCVHAFGPLLDTMAAIKRQYTSRNINNKSTFPLSKIYFHAYGGKLNTVLQILALCEGKSHTKKSTTTTNIVTATTTISSTTKCYFGFAPCVNFRSPKTVEIIRYIGISRLLLETDLEDVSLISNSINDGIQYIATALDLDTTTVIEQTTKNAMEFYNLPNY